MKGNIYLMRLFKKNYNYLKSILLVLLSIVTCFIIFVGLIIFKNNKIKNVSYSYLYNNLITYNKSLKNDYLSLISSQKTIEVSDDNYVYCIDNQIYKLNFTPLEPNSLIFNHKPCAMDIVQGELGDCWILSSLASICESNPSIIKNIIIDNGDGTVTIKLLKKQLNNCTECYYKIKKSIVSNYNVSKSEPWVRLLEKAIVAHMNNELGNDYYDYSIIENFYSSYLFNLLYYNDFNMLAFNKLNKEIYNRIKDSLCNNIPLTTSTKHILLKYKEDNIFSEHTYSILGVAEIKKSKNNIKYYILLRNPYGESFTQDNKNMDDNSDINGTFWIELNDFMNKFNQITCYSNNGTILNPAEINSYITYESLKSGKYQIKLLSCINETIDNEKYINAEFEAMGISNFNHSIIIQLSNFDLIYEDNIVSGKRYYLNKEYVKLKKGESRKFNICFKIDDTKTIKGIRFSVYNEPNFSSIYFLV